MVAWTADEFRTIGAADEIGIASRRSDGSMRPFVTIWAVRSGDDVYIRSAYGADNPWYRRALASGTGRVRADDVERDVTFQPVQGAANEAVDSAYHAKYDRYGRGIVGTVVGEKAHGVTLRLVPTGE